MDIIYFGIGKNIENKKPADNMGFARCGVEGNLRKFLEFGILTEKLMNLKWKSKMENGIIFL